jgi:hypothetical protein
LAPIAFPPRRLCRNECKKSLLVSGEAIWIRVGTSLLMARLGVFSYLACDARSCSAKVGARAAARIHALLGRHDIDIGLGLPP